MKVKYLYVSSHIFSEAVYRTQILDWLDLYACNNLDFELVHQFYINPLNITFHQDQKRKIKKAYSGRVHFEYIHQNYPIFRPLNKLYTLLFFMRFFWDNDRVVIFSRADIGREMKFLKGIFGKKLVYYYDLRAAQVDQDLMSIKNKEKFTSRAYHMVAETAYSEYLRQKIADKVFCVSNALRRYNVEQYHADPDKFVLYPCLSLHSKFYYSKELRESRRTELGYSDEDNVYVYSGGVGNAWHVPASFLRLFDKIARQDAKAKMLVMTVKATKALYEIIENNMVLKDRVTVLEGVPNADIVGYLNAGDFGILLRENFILNNVASPSKYAEYMLCGLPTIISEAVHDYADYCKQNNTGIVFSNKDLANLDKCTFVPLSKSQFDRLRIANVAAEKLSKESAAKRIVEELTVNE